MKKASSIFIGAVISLSCLNTASSASAQQPVSQEANVTFYSVIKHRGEQRKSCINFKIAWTGPSRGSCDLRYGSLYAGDDLDWFESSGAEGNRSVIRDLGAHAWTAKFEVPVVEPLAKLKPGERRQVTIDTSGADGAPGRPGAPGASAASIVRGSSERSTSSLLPSNDGPVPGDISPTVLTTQPPAKPSRPKQDGKPKIDPLFVKAIAGHVYVIHVVDDSRDLYALFRVDALERGDYCTISWKLIPEPLEQSNKPPAR
jgi:hypothetical protein